MICNATQFTGLPGRGLADFARRMESRTEPINILVMGNSVARWNKFHTSTVFRKVLESGFPALRFTTSTGSVEGGFGPSHQLYCGRGEWRHAEIILVHFAELADASNTGGALLLAQLLNLPHAPLVIVVKHCSLPQLEMLVEGRKPLTAHQAQRSL